jgi:hypothetical protein
MSLVRARVAGDMKRRSLLASPPAGTLPRVAWEIAESFRAGLHVAWLSVMWIALHIALGALAFAKVVLLVVSSGRRG